MSLISRLLHAAKPNAAAEERAVRESERLIIAIRRLPGAANWDLLADGEKIISSPNLSLDVVTDLVRRAGGRAIIEYDDQDSITMRLKRKQEGRAVISELMPGMSITVTRDEETRLYAPIRRELTRRLFRIDGVKFDPATTRYVLSSGTHLTVPLEGHDIVDLDEPRTAGL